jgi:hypothetical protein
LDFSRALEVITSPSDSLSKRPRPVVLCTNRYRASHASLLHQCIGTVNGQEVPRHGKKAPHRTSLTLSELGSEAETQKAACHGEACRSLSRGPPSRPSKSVRACSIDCYKRSVRFHSMCISGHKHPQRSLPPNKLQEDTRLAEADTRETPVEPKAATGHSLTKKLSTPPKTQNHPPRVPDEPRSTTKPTVPFDGPAVTGSGKARPPYLGEAGGNRR